MGEQRTDFVVPNPVLLTSGGLTLAASYIPALVVAASSDHDGDKWLYVPIAGPWVDLATRGCGDTVTPTCGVTGFERAALIGTGIIHALGAAQVLAAFTLPQKRLTTTSAQADKPTVQIAPTTFGAHAQGIVAFGTF
jgi:hypothetical protein